MNESGTETEESMQKMKKTGLLLPLRYIQSKNYRYNVTLKGRIGRDLNFSLPFDI